MNAAIIARTVVAVVAIAYAATVASKIGRNTKK